MNKKINGNIYVGSIINLGKRLARYYNYNNLVKGNMLINKALLKYGYSNFSLDIF